MKRGPRSVADLSVIPGRFQTASLPAPRDLGSAGRTLWDAIVSSRPVGFFTPADQVLLAEYCRNMGTYLPRLNESLETKYSATMLDQRDKLIRQSAALARSLRLNVASRTRPDVASMRDSVKPTILNGWASVVEEEP